MDIREKLIADKKNLSNDIDLAVERLNEYIEIIDKLAKQVDVAKEAFESFIKEYEYSDYPISDNFAKEALDKMEEIGK